MNTSIEPIRIRVQPVNIMKESVNLSPREQFWAVLKREEGFAEQSIGSLETRLVRNFGPNLHTHLVKTITDGIRDTERAIYGPEVEQLLQEYRHFFPEMMFRHKEGWPPFSPFDPISKIIDFRQQLFREVPAVRAASERIVLTSHIVFSVRIDGYRSLNLSLFMSQIEKLVQIFESDFNSFRVFLDAFVPVAFGDVFESEFASQLSFEVEIPPALKDVFSQSQATILSGSAVKNSMHSPKEPASSEALNRAKWAKWLWLLVNGSLVVPVLLALIVMFFGFREISTIRTLQYEAIRPILEHQMQLLKEDRERLMIPVSHSGDKSVVSSQHVTVPSANIVQDTNSSPSQP